MNTDGRVTNDTEQGQIDVVRAAVDSRLGSPSEWTRWPGGWQGQISAALVDSVYSARAQYTTKRGRGILPLVKNWMSKSPSTNTIEGLLTEIDAVGGPEQWASSFGNAQHAPKRSFTAVGGPTKAAAIREAAANLADAHIDSADDFVAEQAQAKAALRRVSGIGDATTAYMGMLLGVPDVKPDRMVHRFLSDVLSVGSDQVRLTNSQARALLVAVAETYPSSVTPTTLEHAIWAWQRNQ